MTAEGPGVFEHRLSPRLEWLTDFGVLTKDGFAKNQFSYRKTPLVNELPGHLDDYVAGVASSDDVALIIASRDRRWAELRRPILGRTTERALIEAYERIKTGIGPVPIREVCFLAAVSLEPLPQVSDLRGYLLRWAEREPGIRLSRGRYRREPEMVHFSEEVLM